MSNSSGTPSKESAKRKRSGLVLGFIGLVVMYVSRTAVPDADYVALVGSHSTAKARVTLIGGPAHNLVVFSFLAGGITYSRSVDTHDFPELRDATAGSTLEVKYLPAQPTISAYRPEVKLAQWHKTMDGEFGVGCVFFTAGLLLFAWGSMRAPTDAQKQKRPGRL